MAMLTSVLLQFAVYPTAWGRALIISLLKPGKDALHMTSYRGIRLISRCASWFGQVLDGRLRCCWSATPEQFGFQHGVGCSEAVLVLLTLILSRISEGRRLYVVFVDLRTAFPSLN
eukprot:7811561-Karenia_brevis.AAC.1